MSGSKTISTSETKLESIKFQSSAYGVTVPVVYGVTRISGNLLWYGSFKSIPNTTSQSAGGKGGKTKIKNTTFTYEAALILALGEGQYTSVLKAWRGKTVYPSNPLNAMGLSFANGALGQPVWSFLTSNHPSQAIGYSGIAYVYSSAYDLGTDATVENHNFEVRAKNAYHIDASTPDVDASLVATDMLQNDVYGARFPAAQMDTFASWSTYCRAAGLLLSPALTEQQPAAQMLTKLAQLTNTGIVWSESKLKMIPYGDTELTANGSTFVPNVAPVYDLNYDHFCDKEHPVRQRRKPQADAYNHIRLEFLNRANEYNVEIADAKDQANIDEFGLRSSPIMKAHWVCDAGVAQRIAQLVLQRILYIRNTYSFKLPIHFELLEPMDLVTLTDVGLQLDLLPVRITKITETEDGQLDFEAEDFPLGVADASLYGTQSGLGFQPNYNVSPGSVSAPVFIEAPAQLTQTGLEVLVAARGTDANWGGCNVWVSLNGTEYRQVGTIVGGSRYGQLTGPIAAGSVPVSVLGGQLLSGSALDATSLVTLCFIGGATKEFFAYQTATLTGLNAYTLSGLVRGAYGSSSASAHAVNDPFVRIDDAVARSGPLELSYIGKTIYFKLTSFNVFGGGEESLADATEYTYTVTGEGAQLQPGIGGKAVMLRASTLVFQYPKVGGVNPSSTTLTAERKGLLEGTAVFTVTSGTATLTGTGDVRTLTAANLTTDSATIRVTITDGVGTYTNEVTVSKLREGLDGLAGSPGDKSATVYIYQRKTSVPSNPSVAVTYTFATGGITGLNNGWSATIPAGTDPLYVTAAVASGAGATDSITSGEWASPVVLAQNGIDGLNTATVFLYQRNDTGTPPASPASSLTYTFATGALSGTVTPWAASVPASGGRYLWVTTAVAISTGATDTIGTGEWATVRLLAQNGAEGQNVATVYAYRRAASTPTGPSATATYTFATGGLTGLNNSWSATIPAGTDPLYVILATASSASTTDTIASGEWTAPQILAQDGVNGINGATVFVYQRNNTGIAPSLPSATVTYTFATGAATGLNNGWSQIIPASGGQYLWVSTATAAAATATDTIPSGEWAAARLLAVDGADGLNGAAGLNVATVFIYQRKTSVPAVPSTTATYTFATGGITGLNNGWTATVPAGTEPLYVSIASASSAGATDTIATGEWNTPRVLSQDGTNVAVAFLFRRTTTSTPPAGPTTTVTYTFATGVSTGMNNSWTEELPGSGGGYRWVITAVASSVNATDTIGPGEWSSPSLLSEDGLPAVSGGTDKASVVVDAWSDGVVKSGQLPVTVTAFAKLGGTTDTANWVWTRSATSGITTTISGAVVSITAITSATDSGTVTITGTKTGFDNIVVTVAVSKAKDTQVSAGPVSQSLVLFAGAFDLFSSTYTVSSRIEFRADGTIYRYSFSTSGGTTTVKIGDWYLPTTGSIGSSYTLTVGSVTRNGATGTVSKSEGAITTTRDLQLTYTGSTGAFYSSATAPYVITRNSDGAQVGSGILDLSITHEV